MSEPLVENKRLHDRVRFRTWVKIVDGAGLNLLGNIEDLSPVGLGLLHNAPLGLGQDCEIYFMLPWRGREHIIQVYAQVASCEPAPVGGQFRLGFAFQAFATNATDAEELIQTFMRHSENQAEHANGLPT